MKNKIIKSINKFKLNLHNRIVLTEAASGNYVVTPVIAAAAGAEKVYAFTKDSKFASVEEVEEQTFNLAIKLNVEYKIKILTSLKDIPWRSIDILTNTGFNRPLDSNIISKINSNCVIPLMWEPWEYRPQEIDLIACRRKGVKVYGTNESDCRVQTLRYIGFLVLRLLLENGCSPFSSNVLIIGSNRFVNPVKDVLKKNDYSFFCVTEYKENFSIDEFDVIVILEHERDICIIGDRDSFLNYSSIADNTLVLHICGNVDFSSVNFKFLPQNPASFGYMSFTADYIDNQAVIDLHTAGLKVAEGMLRANEKKLNGYTYKEFMEINYPALAFDNKELW